MKILVNAISAKRGGIVTYTQNLIEALRARGVEAVFAVPPEVARRHAGSAILMRASDYSPLRRFLWEQAFWRHRVREIAPDVLFSSANFGLLRSPVPQVLLLREGGLFDPFYLANIAPEQGAGIATLRHFRRRLMLLSARRADHVITPSQAMRDMLLRWAPDVAAKCTVNPYGTPSDLYRPPPAPRPWRSDGVLRLIFVSVYYPHKNPSVLCAAVGQLRRDGIDAHATITMDLAEARIPGGALDRIVLDQSARDGLITIGHCDYRDLPALYGAHDVFVFPSVSETFGHPMAEALSTGLPIVAADTAINREICGEAALYFRPFSPSALVGCIRALDSDPALRARLRDAALARAQTAFSWDAHVDRLIARFEAVHHAARQAA